MLFILRIDMKRENSLSYIWLNETAHIAKEKEEEF